VDWALVEVSAECLLAFDVDGVIVGANTGARRLLRACRPDQSVYPLVGSSLPSVFKVDMAEIWRMSRMGSISERTVLSTRMHELYYAMVNPPRHFGTKLARTLAASAEQADCPALDQWAGQDAHMRRLIDQAKRLVNKKVNILLHGETGTGKELVARACHQAGPRAQAPFIEINCAALPGHLVVGELFGFEKGAFTDAHARKIGLIEAADGGTLFLDEIGELDLALHGWLELP
jgi:transcriptional regulator with GAF, ATPase, and Fis domain